MRKLQLSYMSRRGCGNCCFRELRNDNGIFRFYCYLDSEDVEIKNTLYGCDQWEQEEDEND